MVHILDHIFSISSNIKVITFCDLVRADIELHLNKLKIYFKTNQKAKILVKYFWKKIRFLPFYWLKNNRLGSPIKIQNVQMKSYIFKHLSLNQHLVTELYKKYTYHIRSCIAVEIEIIIPWHIYFRHVCNCIYYTTKCLFMENMSWYFTSLYSYYYSTYVGHTMTGMTAVSSCT